MLVYCEMIMTIKLINVTVALPSYLIFSRGVNTWALPLGKFYIHNILLFLRRLQAMLRSKHLLTSFPGAWSHTPPSPCSPESWDPGDLPFHSLDTLVDVKVRTHSFVLLCLMDFTAHQGLHQSHPGLLEGAGFPSWSRLHNTCSTEQDSSTVWGQLKLMESFNQREAEEADSRK